MMSPAFSRNSESRNDSDLSRDLGAAAAAAATAAAPEFRRMLFRTKILKGGGDRELFFCCCRHKVRKLEMDVRELFNFSLIFEEREMLAALKANRLSTLKLKLNDNRLRIPHNFRGCHTKV